MPDLETNMFDRDDAIARWRRQLAADGIKSPEILDELESHLRDDVEQRAHCGLDPEQAFEAAVKGLGETNALQWEFKKLGATHRTQLRKAKQAILTLAGIPNQYCTNDMNTPTITQNLEPRWATYAKAAVFLVPGLALLSFSAMFLFPKVQEICRDAGLPNSSGDSALAVIMRNGNHIVLDHGVLITAAILLALIFLEWRSEKWPRYRRATVGVGVFLLNSSILVLITVTLTLALLAAPALFHAR